MATNVRAIRDADLPAVAEFLHRHLNPGVSPDEWVRACTVPWGVRAPNHGYMLVDQGRVVGAYLAFYADREIDGRSERFCNLGAWCVLDEFRFKGLRLLKAILAQQDVHFTDLSPSGNVIALNQRLGFRFLDTTTALVPNLPYPSVPGRIRIVRDTQLIEERLSEPHLTLFRDHLLARAARHAMIDHDGDTCYVMYRRVRRKNLPLFATVLWVSNPEVFLRAAHVFARHLLFHDGVLATLVENRIVGGQVPLSRTLRSPRPKMYLSNRLNPSQMDDLYSELVCVPW